jgi:hypothetical protein
VQNPIEPVYLAQLLVSLFLAILFLQSGIEKIVVRNYEGKIFDYPETGNENVLFAPQREYHDEYLYS